MSERVSMARSGRFLLAILGRMGGRVQELTYSQLLDTNGIGRPQKLLSD